jgi:2-polyprenyl-3-methyl-5-hydroxy-6-metoxy-1,4-benzoquinol methylase
MERNTIKEFYAHEGEADRLEQEAFQLEGIRTKEIIERYLHKDHLNILDIGGGAGYYSFWHQGKGHQVTLIDLDRKSVV